MATKDWKLVSEEDDQVQWFSKRTQTSLFVYRQDYDNGKESEWFVEQANSKKTFFESKPKKTKSEALRLAKQYMRTH